MALATIEDILAAVDGQTVPRRFMELVAAHPDHDALHARLDDAPGLRDTWSPADYRELVALRGGGVGESRCGAPVIACVDDDVESAWISTGPTPHTAPAWRRRSVLTTRPRQSRSSTSPATPRLRWRSSRTPGFQRLLKIRGSAAGPTTNLRDRAGPIGRLPAGVHLASELLDAGHRREALAATYASDIAMLIDTSGTTGPPKGVMLSQHNIVYIVEQLRRCTPFDDFVGKRSLSFLPMPTSPSACCAITKARFSAIASIAARTRTCLAST